MIVRLLNARPRVAQHAFGEIRVDLRARKQRAGGLSEAMQAPIGDGALAIEPFLCGLPVTEAALTENVGRALDAGCALMIARAALLSGRTSSPAVRPVL
jgi:hypothetical protein